MAGYFGTDIQQRLQARAEASQAFIDHTPGACQMGRTIGCDDPANLGWDRMGEIIDRDGMRAAVNAQAGLRHRFAT